MRAFSRAAEKLQRQRDATLLALINNAQDPKAAKALMKELTKDQP